MFTIITDIRELIAAFREGRYTDALRAAARIQLSAADLIEAFTDKALMGAESNGELDAALAELEAVKAAPVPKGADPTDPRAIDPATILTIITAVIELIKFLRERRKK